MLGNKTEASMISTSTYCSSDQIIIYAYTIVIQHLKLGL